MPDYLKVLIPSAVGFVTTVAAAFFSARWAVRRAFEERWWARKEQAYTEIIEALHDLLRYASIEAEARRTGEQVTDTKGRNEFRALYLKAYWKVQKMTDIGAFVISDGAAEILRRLRQRPKLAPEYDPPLDVREEEVESYREALDGIRECARQDLRV